VPRSGSVPGNLTVQTMTRSTHFHHFFPGSILSAAPVVLFHGSGGDEHALVPLAADVAPGSPTLCLRGTVAIDGGFAFFHRRPDRSIDEADLEARIPPLSEFISATIADQKPPVAVGFSNGAIMAAALLFTRPTLFGAAVLFRPLSPFLEDRPAALNGKPVLIIDGEKDSRRSPGDGARLALRLSNAGATVTHHVLPCGHTITTQDQQLARDWLRELGDTTRPRAK
jgi:phospholipase/carboxylesterase